MSETTQNVEGKNNQVAAGDITTNDVHVEVSVEAPRLHIVSDNDSEAWQRELAAHVEFKKRVGIECSRQARLELERLLIEHNFTPRQLKIVWRNTTLRYDEDKRGLTVSPSKPEAIFGFSFFVIGILAVSPSIIGFLASETSALANAAFLPIFGMYAFLLAMLGRTFILPYRIGRRLQRVLK